MFLRFPLQVSKLSVNFVTIPVSKVLLMIYRISLLSTLVANHVIQGSLTIAACFLFLADGVVIFGFILHGEIISTVGGCKKGTGAGSICIGGQALGS